MIKEKDERESWGEYFGYLVREGYLNLGRASVVLGLANKFGIFYPKTFIRSLARELEVKETTATLFFHQISRLKVFEPVLIRSLNKEKIRKIERILGEESNKRSRVYKLSTVGEKLYKYIFRKDPEEVDLFTMVHRLAEGEIMEFNNWRGEKERKVGVIYVDEEGEKAHKKEFQGDVVFDSFEVNGVKSFVWVEVYGREDPKGLVERVEIVNRHNEVALKILKDIEKEAYNAGFSDPSEVRDYILQERRRITQKMPLIYMAVWWFGSGNPFPNRLKKIGVRFFVERRGREDFVVVDVKKWREFQLEDGKIIPLDDYLEEEVERRMLGSYF